MRQRIINNFLLITIGLAVLVAVAMKATIFQQTPPAKPAAAVDTRFSEYWFAGKAELNSYRLEQAQYGELNRGTAVLIFVTEDFRTDTQVKSETDASKDRAIPVLKTNLVRKFTTGIYDYSLFTSVFTPISNPKFPNTLKVSTSGQEWCGHSYVQLNLKNDGYRVNGRSYFEQEANEEYTVKKQLLEDELWNRIRLNPGQLPTGDVTLIPGTVQGRLRHKRLDPLAAKAQLEAYTGSAFSGNALKAYSVDYAADGRKLTIVFEDAFPHRIVGWEETYKSKDKLLTSRAVLQKTILSDYWNHNAPADSVLRKELTL
ncbi:hypothetical protein [Rudanella lutea]|uniref:hypothetical protein n=1 Tax=Rudanella lutea TaxID=451374 RepID=UPI0003664B60|nr:hypothetical protein [Rudanella lutea]